MNDLKKCPICGGAMDWSGPRYFVWCANCGFRGSANKSFKEATEVYNRLCEEVEVGRAMLYRVPDGCRLTEEPKTGQWRIIWDFESVPAPPLTKDDVLRECRDWFGGGEGNKQIDTLLDHIDAVLAKDTKQKGEVK